MAKIIGNTTATPNPRPDWNQTDETKADYIENKPDLLAYTKTWLSNTEYKAGDLVIATKKLDDGTEIDGIIVCSLDHISPDVSFVNEDSEYDSRWTEGIIGLQAIKSYKDSNDNIIHETYATKEETGKKVESVNGAFPDENLNVTLDWDAFELIDNSVVRSTSVVKPKIIIPSVGSAINFISWSTQRGGWNDEDIEISTPNLITTDFRNPDNWNVDETDMRLAYCILLDNYNNVSEIYNSFVLNQTYTLNLKYVNNTPGIYPKYFSLSLGRGDKACRININSSSASTDNALIYFKIVPVNGDVDNPDMLTFEYRKPTDEDWTTVTSRTSPTTSTFNLYLYGTEFKSDSLTQKMSSIEYLQITEGEQKYDFDLGIGKKGTINIPIEGKTSDSYNVQAYIDCLSKNYFIPNCCNQISFPTFANTKVMLQVNYNKNLKSYITELQKQLVELNNAVTALGGSE